MGCCLSAEHAVPASGNARIGKSLHPAANPILEEETVKEVLSETRAAIPRPSCASPSRRIPKAQDSREVESPFIKIAPLLDFSRAVHDKRHQNGAAWKKPPPFTAAFGNDDMSEEVSEICSSLSESVSASTEKRGNEWREIRHRSPAASKSRPHSGEVKREKTVGRSPGRRSEPSPNRVTGSGFVRKRDSGESSGRRSRSPVMRLEPTPPKTGPGQSQSAKKTGRSPGRVGSGLSERTRKLEEGGDSNKWALTSNESLENPLVSLECFIFL